MPAVRGLTEANKHLPDKIVAPQQRRGAAIDFDVPRTPLFAEDRVVWAVNVIRFYPISPCA